VDIIANARWFATLVIAEIAGIVKFAEAFHRWRFVVLVVALIILSLAAVALILAIVFAQLNNKRMETNITKLVLNIAATDFSDATNKEVSGLRDDIAKFLDATNNETDAVLFSNAGLVAFLFGTFLAGVALVV